MLDYTASGAENLLSLHIFHFQWTFCSLAIVFADWNLIVARVKSIYVTSPLYLSKTDANNLPNSRTAYRELFYRFLVCIIQKLKRWAVSTVSICSCIFLWLSLIYPILPTRCVYCCLWRSRWDARLPVKCGYLSTKSTVPAQFVWLSPDT